MTPQELAELDLAVARIEGLSEARIQNYWFEEKGVFCVKAPPNSLDYWLYQPTRDAQEAMRLMAAYKIDLAWYEIAGFWIAGHAVLTVRNATGETPCIAICKAVCQLGWRK